MAAPVFREMFGTVMRWFLLDWPSRLPTRGGRPGSVAGCASRDCPLQRGLRGPVFPRGGVDCGGRLPPPLPLATRLLLVKADGSVLVHSDGGSYKPLNWMSPPCTLTVGTPSDVDAAAGVQELWTVRHAKSDDELLVRVHEVLHDSAHDLGIDPGLVKD